MTQDRKDDSKGSRETEKSHKKTESSAPVSKEKTTSSAEGLPTKIVVRRLPPAWTAETFVEQISLIPDHDYLHFVAGDVSLGQHSYSRAYINLTNRHDIAVFIEKFDGYVFVDSRGFEYPAIVEFAPFLKVPKKRAKKADPRKGTIESDDDYLKFVEKLENAEPEVIPTPDVFLEEIEAREKQMKENVPVSTPLIEFMVRRREEKKLALIQAREERKRKELERRRVIEEQRRREREKEQQKQRDKDRDKDKDRERDKDRDRERDTSAVTSKKTDEERAPVKLLKNPEREREQREKSRGQDDRKTTSNSSSTRPAARSEQHEAGTHRDRQTDRETDRQTDSRTARHVSSTVKNETRELTEPGERGGATSARQRPGPQRPTNRESDDRRVKLPANERQDDRERKAESEKGRDKRREDTRLTSGEGDTMKTERDQKSQRSYRDHPPTHRESASSARDHTQTHRESASSARDHTQTQKEYRGYRSERREPYKDQRTATRDQRPLKDSRARDRRSDTQGDESRARDRQGDDSRARDRRSDTQGDESRTRDRRSDTQGDEVHEEAAVSSGRKSEDHTECKQTLKFEGKSSRGPEDRLDKDKDDNAKHEKNVKQRVRNKDRPERAIYNPARRAEERQKDSASLAHSAASRASNSSSVNVDDGGN